MITIKKRAGIPIRMRKAIRLVISVLIPLIAGAIGSIFTSSAIPTWYAALEKPAFNPPNWLFGPVWTALYILMGIALYLVWTSKGPRRNAFVWFGAQIVLNALWSILFFGLKSPWLAFIEIVLLWGAILGTILAFKKLSTTAAYLMVPYICWVSFAAVLNVAIAVLN